MPLLNKLKQQLSFEPLLSATHIVVAYSGGVDSHVLLHALHYLRQQAQLNFQLSAIHIHHGLSDNADQWQSHCQQVCKQLAIPFQTANVSLNLKPRQSLEAHAREMRYQKLVELAPVNSQVLLGQHQDDQLETFLLQLKRGAGPKGLSAMGRTWQASDKSNTEKTVNFYRPLLDMSRQAILAYAQTHKLTWCEDESNQNTDFERNFLRHKVLPIMQQRWPGIASTVARSAALCAQQQELLEECCEEKLRHIVASESSLHIPELQKLSQAWMHQIVRYWLNQKGIQSPSLAVLNLLKPEVFDANDDATPILQWQGWQFRRYDQQLYVIAQPPVKVDFNSTWQDETQIQLPYQLGNLVFSGTIESDNHFTSHLNVDPELGPLIIRMGGYAVKFKPKGSRYSKPVNQWFKQWKVAPWSRETAVLVIQNEKVLGLFCEGQWRHSEQSANHTGSIWITHLNV